MYCKKRHKDGKLQSLITISPSQLKRYKSWKWRTPTRWVRERRFITSLREFIGWVEKLLTFTCKLITCERCGHRPWCPWYCSSSDALLTDGREIPTSLGLLPWGSSPKVMVAGENDVMRGKSQRGGKLIKLAGYWLIKAGIKIQQVAWKMWNFCVLWVYGRWTGVTSACWKQCRSK